MSSAMASGMIEAGERSPSRPMYEWIDHESEMELSIEAESPQAVMREALGALGELIAGGASSRTGGHEVRLQLRSPDPPTLLADWLDELAFLAETDGFVPDRVVRMALTDTTVDAKVAGHRSAPQSLIKGVTHHHLEMREEDGTWRARVVVDV